MGKKLIIAEKPAVAENIAKALDSKATAEQHSPQYFELHDYVIASAAGHLVKLDCPEEFMPEAWSIDTLPIIPPRFDVCPIEESRPFLDLITKLLQRPDITEIVNACDAGREGELIFRLIMQHTNAQQPTERLWLQSLTPESIRESLNNLRSDEQMRPLADAAYCRSEADWTVGINGSRAVSVYMAGGVNAERRPMSVGRVQTPTLAMLVEREAMIASHRPRAACDIRGEFAVSSESDSRYTAHWIDEQFSKDETEAERAQRLSTRLGVALPDVAADDDSLFGTLRDADRQARTLWHHEIAQAIATKCQQKPCVVEEQVRTQRENPPQLFNTTALAVEANSRFGFSAKHTDKILRSLWNMKVLTYPSVSERHLPESDVAKTQDMLKALPPAYAPLAAKILENGWCDSRKDIFDDAKLKDHYAIIPTGTQPSDLSEPQRKIFDLVARRTLAAFFPASEYRVTTRLTRCEGELFKCESRVLVAAGWREVYGKEGDAAAGDGARSLCAIDPSQPVMATNMLLETRKTKPPARYTDASLLKSMESAGKTLEDEDLRTALKDAGLGTPATRAEIIETLIGQEYVRRQRRELAVTGKGMQLIQLLKDVGVSELIRPDLTGEWEHKLQQMQDGEFARAGFMAQINSFTQRFVDAFRGEPELDEAATLRAPCPTCGGVLRVQPRRARCGKCGYAFPRIIKQRLFTVSELETLMATRSIGPLHNFIGKNGQPFSASLVLGEGEKLEFNFDGPAGIDLNELPPLGKCCCCGGDVVDDGFKFVCRNSSGTSTQPCPFSMNKTMCSREIDETELQQVLSDGKTDYLKGFVSPRTGRGFSAFLVLKPDRSGVQFEFKQRQNAKEDQK